MMVRNFFPNVKARLQSKEPCLCKQTGLMTLYAWYLIQISLICFIAFCVDFLKIPK